MYLLCLNRTISSGRFKGHSTRSFYLIDLHGIAITIEKHLIFGIFVQIFLDLFHHYCNKKSRAYGTSAITDWQNAIDLLKV